MTQTPNDALRLVPVEPTEAMQNAGVDAATNLFEGWVDEGQVSTLYRSMLSAAPASPLPGGGWPVHIVRANGATVDEQRRAVLKSETYKHGDMVLVWVSEGDLYGNPFVELEQLPAAPTGAE